jgi:protein-disulfide isomerase
VNSHLETWRVDVATSGHPVRGNANAPVTLVEFSDFECPYCGGLFPTLKQIEETYRGKVRIVYRQYPLASHPRAQKAAEASLCANEQRRFWDFHDALFANQKDLTVEALKRRANELKLDAKAFEQCLTSGRHAETVRRDIQEGSQLGVTGTPAAHSRCRRQPRLIPNVGCLAA